VGLSYSADYNVTTDGITSDSTVTDATVAITVTGGGHCEPGLPTTKTRP
jgi:hypothetical protein